ncbi:hypothetical protein AB0B28_03970 [Glycomyces sp. NPDC046736]|uniref:hypothetical protein n=1 Tax=Glycomyces sp. NPDC046736 TaxID=3155615 RepID=UPI0033EECFEE
MIEDASDRFLGLGRWMADEIGPDFEIALDALAFVDAASHRRELPGEWSSEGYEVLFSAEGLTIQNLWDESSEPPLNYSIGEAREAIEEYAEFLMSLPERANVVREFRPDLLAWQAALLWWEQYWKRPHPYRGRLGLPATGPA